MPQKNLRQTGIVDFCCGQVFTDRERSKLLNDAMNLARAGQLNYHIALDITNYLPFETHLLPWDAVVSSFDYITQQLYNDEDFSLWQASLHACFAVFFLSFIIYQMSKNKLVFTLP